MFQVDSKLKSFYSKLFLLMKKMSEEPVVQHLPVISAAQSGDSKRLQAETR